MAKTTEQLAASKAGSTLESNGFGSQERPQRPAGLYRHPETGEEVITKFHPTFGSAQADAVVRVGFVFIRPVQDGDVVQMSRAPLKRDDSDSDEMRGLKARIRDLEDRKVETPSETSAPTDNEVPTADVDETEADEAQEVVENSVLENQETDAPVTDNTKSTKKGNKK